MINTMTIDGYDAVIQYDSDIKMSRGEFIGLNGGADFYAKSVEGLMKTLSLTEIDTRPIQLLHSG